MERKRLFIVLGLFGVLALILPGKAQAVPSFARQTGLSCDSCHTIFPELTPVGRDFKLKGYVLSKSKKPYEFPPPLTAYIDASYTHTQKAQPSSLIKENNSSHFLSTGNDNINAPQYLSIFYAGRIVNNLGGFIQGTYGGVEDRTYLDSTDVRYADSVSVLGKNLVWGFTINNNPSLEDLWNTTPAFRFPFNTSSVVPAPAAKTKIDGTLAQQVGGIGGYLFWNDLIYGAASVYRTAKDGVTEFLGGGTHTTDVLDGVAPYWRLAIQRQWDEHSLSFGTYGMFTNIFPEDKSTGPSNSFTDVALDAQYQFISQKHVFTTAMTWIHEDQNWKAGFPLGSTANSSSSLDTFRITSSYYYRKSLIGSIGGAVSYFTTTGTTDNLLYAPANLTGSRTGSPDSNGFIIQLDYLPLDIVKFTLQYTIYDKFNGAHSNYDGFGRSASGNNTLFFNALVQF